MHSKWVWLCPEIPTAVRVGIGSETLLTECSETSDYLFLCLSPFQASTRDTSGRWRERWTGATSSKQSAKGRLKIWALSFINSCDFQLWCPLSLDFFICKMEILPSCHRNQKWGHLDNLFYIRPKIIHYSTFLFFLNLSDDNKNLIFTIIIFCCTAGLVGF